jgi:hypothetical protein
MGIIRKVLVGGSLLLLGAGGAIGYDLASEDPEIKTVVLDPSGGPVIVGTTEKPTTTIATRVVSAGGTTTEVPANKPVNLTTTTLPPVDGAGTIEIVDGKCVFNPGSEPGLFVVGEYPIAIYINDPDKRQVLMPGDVVTVRNGEICLTEDLGKIAALDSPIDSAPANENKVTFEL